MEDKSKIVPVHLRKDEVRYCNFLQGGQFIDPETELREYSRLGEVLQNPKTRQLCIKLSNFLKENKRLPHKVEIASNQMQREIPSFKAIPSDKDYQVQKFEAAGTKKDKILVMFPVELVNFLDKLQGTKNLDPVYGLQEFMQGSSSMSELFKALASIKEIDKSNPSVPSLLEEEVGKASSDSANSGAGLSGSGANSISGAGGKSIAPGGGSGLGGNSGAGPLDALTSVVTGGLGAYLTHRGEKKEARQKYEQEMRNYEESKQRAKNALNSGLMNTPMHGAGLKTYDPQRNKHKYAKGGLLAVKGEPIIGPGRGQDDVINRDRIKEGGWIWNATNVAHLGDGATDAGQKHIESFEKEIKKQLLKPHAKMIAAQEKAAPPRNVPCALSNGERHTPRPLVTALGEGDNKHGAHILRKINEKITEHKLSNGKKLPPPAHDLMTYYKMVS